jgi:hypothetical protein
MQPKSERLRTVRSKNRAQRPELRDWFSVARLQALPDHEGQLQRMPMKDKIAMTMTIRPTR